MRLKTTFLLIFSVCSFAVSSQSIGNYFIEDSFRSAIHPNCSEATDKFIVGLPNDSIWVNLEDSTTMSGFFGTAWANQLGNDLVIETGFHKSNYQIRLILADNSFSKTHFVNITDEWILLNPDVPWVVLFKTCSVNMVQSERWIIPLDFLDDFDLTQSDKVKGVEITFLPTLGAPDLSGVHVVMSKSSSLAERYHEKFHIYPNPVNNTLHFEIQKNIKPNLKIRILNLAGQPVHFQDISSFSTEINTSGLPQGSYFIEFRDNVDFLIKRFIKIKS